MTTQICRFINLIYYITGSQKKLEVQGGPSKMTPPILGWVPIFFLSELPLRLLEATNLKPTHDLNHNGLQPLRNLEVQWPFWQRLEAVRPSLL